MTERKINVAITHWQRFTLLKDCLLRVITDPRIGEIVISDDFSQDGSYEQIGAWLTEIMGDPSKPYVPVKLFRNERNKDCYRNKKLAISRTTAPDWTILFDSDNVLTPEYIDALFAIPEWNPRIAYCPEFAEPRFDFRHLAGQTIDKNNVARYMHDNRFRTMLNAMNYFVHATEYNRVWDKTVDPVTADSIYQNYRWLLHGNSLYVVPGLRYYHRIHEDSHFKLNFKRTGGFHKDVEAKLRAMK